MMVHYSLLEASLGLTLRHCVRSQDLKGVDLVNTLLLVKTITTFSLLWYLHLHLEIIVKLNGSQNKKHSIVLNCRHCLVPHPVI